ncbi:PREDICTED: uncharacterized protein LOC108526809 [Rhinopithecus bieti]|uniref:uncharacterized protein LOC108526809 n=1 Tax=Rhinopithecus bieti TaxID=61621 RepID=UPI00083C6502|nr:PREDICTED: uncharacterized protein LOC108526809 [Rhinopithecus bieti]
MLGDSWRNSLHGGRSPWGPAPALSLALSALTDSPSTSRAARCNSTPPTPRRTAPRPSSALVCAASHLPAGPPRGTGPRQSERRLPQKRAADTHRASHFPTGKRDLSRHLSLSGGGRSRQFKALLPVAPLFLWQPDARRFRSRDRRKGRTIRKWDRGRLLLEARELDGAAVSLRFRGRPWGWGAICSSLGCIRNGDVWMLVYLCPSGCCDALQVSYSLRAVSSSVKWEQ